MRTEASKGLLRCFSPVFIDSLKVSDMFLLKEQMEDQLNFIIHYLLHVALKPTDYTSENLFSFAVNLLYKSIAHVKRLPSFQVPLIFFIRQVN